MRESQEAVAVGNVPGTDALRRRDVDPQIAAVISWRGKGHEMVFNKGLKDGSTTGIG